MRKGWFIAALLYLALSVRVHTVPICAFGQFGCSAPSLAELFDRIIQQSSRMHGISSDMHSEFQRDFFPNKNFVGKQRCHTHGIVTPGDKENAKRLGREKLTEVIVRLLEAWREPLSQLYWSTSLDQNHHFNHDSASHKALQITDMVQELRGGLAKIAAKMKSDGVLGNTVEFVSSDTSDPASTFNFYRRGELNSMHRHDLLYCFRRDSNKVQNYLRILKCTTLPELDC